jgi:hypothetical protein
MLSDRGSPIPIACPEVATLSELSGPYTYSSALGDEVVPTVELIRAHKHPDDRAGAEDILAEVFRVGGHFSIYHRIIDARGRPRQVLTAGEGILDASGKVTAVDGVMVDLTLTLQRETEQAARDAVAGATATRSVIDQARGVLMGRLLITSEEAFRLLAGHSSRTNIKVSVVAPGILRLLESPEGPERLDGVIQAIQAAAAPHRKDARG